MNKNIIRLTESQLHNVIKESVKRVLKEQFYPKDDEDITHDGDYSYGAIMTVECDIPRALDDETVEKLNSISQEYIEDEYKYTSVMVNSIYVNNDTEYDYAEVTMEIAVSSADMPLDAINDEIEDMVWYWIEEKTHQRMIQKPNIQVKRVVFDRREYYTD